MVCGWQYTKPSLSTRYPSSSCARALCLGHAFVYFGFMGSLRVFASYLLSFLAFAFCILKRSLNASRPSEHPPVRGKNIKTILCGVIGYKDKTSPWYSNGFPDGR